jgi:Tetratricopeptide repeat
VRGAEHDDTASSLGNLAVLLRAQGDLAGPESLGGRALAIYDKVLGAECPTIAVGVNLLGVLQQDRGNLGEAEWRENGMSQLCPLPQT